MGSRPTRRAFDRRTDRLFSPIAAASAVSEETCDMPPHAPAPPLSLRLPPSSRMSSFSSPVVPSFVPLSLPPIPSNHSPPAKKPNSLPSSLPLRSAAREGEEEQADRQTTCLAGLLPAYLPPSAVCTLHSRRRRRRRRSALQPLSSSSAPSISSPSPSPPSPSHENLGIYLLSHQFQSL